MELKGASKKENNTVSRHQPCTSMTLREEATCKKQVNVNSRTMSRIGHLKSLALWAATEAYIPSLGAFFGQRLAACTEAVGVRSDPNFFFCKRSNFSGSDYALLLTRCESILQPGKNCTVRTEKIKTNNRCRQKKSDIGVQNNVVYNCHFCSHRNLMRGTLKNFMQEIIPPKTTQPSRLDTSNRVVERFTSLTQSTPSSVEANKMDAVGFPISDRQGVAPSSPSTPLTTTGLSLLDAKRRKRNRPSA